MIRSRWEVSLLSATHKVSNMIFSLNFYQKEPVGDNREAATYQLYFTDMQWKADQRHLEDHCG